MTTAPQKHRIVVIRWSKMRIAAWLAGICVFFLLCIVTAIPIFFNSEKFRDLLQENASRLSGGQVAIGFIHFRWPAHLELRKVRFHAHANTSLPPDFAVDAFRFNLDFHQLLQRRLGFNVDIRGARLQYLRDKTGRTNLDKLLANQPASETNNLSEPEDGRILPEDMSFDVPLDVYGRFVASDIAVLVSDALNDRAVFYENGRLAFETNGAVTAASSLTLTGEARTGGVAVPMAVSATFNPGGAGVRSVSALNSRLGISASFPGLRLKMGGGLWGTGIAGNLDIDFKTLHTTVQNLLPGAFPEASMSGTAGLEFQARLKERREIVFGTSLSFASVRLLENPWLKQSVGPLDIRFRQKGRYLPRERALRLSDGVIEILEKSRIQWQGSLNQTPGESFSGELKVGPLILDLGEIHQCCAFLPPAVTAGMPEEWAPQATLGARYINVTFNTRDGLKDIRMGDVELTAPEMDIKSEAGHLQSGRLSFVIHALESDFSEMFPNRIHLDIGAECRNLTAHGNSAVKIDRIALPVLHIRGDRLAVNPTARFGITGEFDLQQSLTISSLHIPGIVSLPDAGQKIKGHLALLPEMTVSGSGIGFDLEVPQLRIDLPSTRNTLGGHFFRDVAFSVSTGEIQARSAGIPAEVKSAEAVSALSVDLNACKARISVANLMNVDLAVNATDTGRNNFFTQGRLTLDAAGLSELLSAMQWAKQDLTGTADIDWHYSGRLPDDNELDRMAQEPFWKPSRDLAFVNKMKIQCGLDFRGARIGIPEEKRFENPLNGAAPLEAVVVDLVGRPLIRYQYDGVSGAGKINAAIGAMITPEKRNPWIDSPKSVSFVVDGGHEELKVFRLHQELKIPQLSFLAEAELSAFDLDRAAARRWAGMPVLPAVLTALGGDIAIRAAMDDMESIAPMAAGLEAGGSISAGIDLRLFPASNISGAAWLKLSNVDVRSPSFGVVSGLNGGGYIDKYYRLDTRFDRGGPGLAVVGDRLSRDVFAELGGSRGETDPGIPALGSVLERMDSRLSDPDVRSRQFSLKSAVLNTPPIQLRVDNVSTGLKLKHGLPAVERFQMDILGGHVLGSASIVKQSEELHSKLELHFSGIDTAAMMTGLTGPAAADALSNRTAGTAETEVAGRLVFDAPLSPDLAGILEKTYLDVTFTSIGSRALERLLYALDPYESNTSFAELRRMLRSGYPQWIKCRMKDGNLSLNGAIRIEGIPVPIPPIERLNVSQLAGLSAFSDTLGRLTPIVRFLQNASASRLGVGGSGQTVEFKR